MMLSKKEQYFYSLLCGPDKDLIMNKYRSHTAILGGLLDWLVKDGKVSVTFNLNIFKGGETLEFFELLQGEDNFRVYINYQKEPLIQVAVYDKLRFR